MTTETAGRRTERLIRERIEALLHARPSDRRERIWARSVADLRRAESRAREGAGS